MRKLPLPRERRSSLPTITPLPFPVPVPYSVLFSQEQIAERVEVLAREIQTALPRGEDIIVLALLNGGLWFAADLLRLLPSEFVLKTLKISSYGSDRTSSGVVTLHEPLSGFSGKITLILDDVADTGLTLARITADIRAAGAKEVYTAVAVDKQGLRQVEFVPDFSAFTAGHEFLIGYGMDYDARYRNLPFIAVLEE